MIWFWFSIAIIALIFELTTGVLYFLVLSLSFALTACFIYFFKTSFTSSMIIASIFSLIGILMVAFWNKNRKKIQNIVEDPDIGQIVVIEEALSNGHYYVRYRGTLWEAALKKTAIKKSITGFRAKIVDKKSNIFEIELLD